MVTKALVVDDSATDLLNIKTILSDAGCIVVTASDGAEAIAKAKAEHPAIIFLDVIMPGMDGYEACRLLSGDPATREIPIVFVTSKGQKADKVWGQVQGAKGHLVKPFTAEQVIDQLKALT
ncbi:response regulator [Thiobaca trueperi]|uniref:Twitching motility two-component system response regulator PilH n=1 Tax=Thiobaca trueperi TaxID=127458 RepID=A0A4R3MTQ1_9GAMM|nr:response regulator [Thiobaca trueperi]TCT19820.1 twitching motility two-component system response regulator PilH [Thiobaca trueperi]